MEAEAESDRSDAGPGRRSDPDSGPARRPKEGIAPAALARTDSRRPRGGNDDYYNGDIPGGGDGAGYFIQVTKPRQRRAARSSSSAAGIGGTTMSTAALSMSMSMSRTAAMSMSAALEPPNWAASSAVAVGGQRQPQFLSRQTLPTISFPEDPPSFRTPEDEDNDDGHGENEEGDEGTMNDDRGSGDDNESAKSCVPCGELRSMLCRIPVPWDDFLAVLRRAAAQKPSDSLDEKDERASVLRELASGREGDGTSWRNPSLLQRALMETEPPGIPPEAVRWMLELDPALARDADPEGRTALSYACSNRADGEIVRLLLGADPSAARRRTTKHATIPLHAAYKADTARALLEVFPEGVRVRDMDGELPLHAIASWGDAEAAAVLVEVGREEGLCRDRRGVSAVGGIIGSDGHQDGVSGEGRPRTRQFCGGALIEDKRGRTPLDRASELVVALSERDEPSAPPADLRRSFIFVRKPILGHAALKPLCNDGLEAFRKYEALARAAWEHSSARACHPGAGTSSPPFQVLHCAIELDSPPEVVSHAAALDPGRVKERNARGETPLHLAAALAGRRRSERDEADIDDDDNDTASEIVDMLLNSRSFGSTQPAWTPDDKGRLPLHIAALSRMTFRRHLIFGEDGGPLEKILGAEPRALDVPDGDGMLPFMLAAVAKDSNDVSSSGKGRDERDINTVYRLLRESPAVLEVHCPAG